MTQRVVDSTGQVHSFPDEATPEMIAKAFGATVRAAPQSAAAPPDVPIGGPPVDVPQVGEIRGDYRFTGGDQFDRANWDELSGGGAANQFLYGNNRSLGHVAMAIPELLDMGIDELGAQTGLYEPTEFSPYEDIWQPLFEGDGIQPQTKGERIARSGGEMLGATLPITGGALGAAARPAVEGLSMAGRTLQQILQSISGAPASVAVSDVLSSVGAGVGEQLVEESGGGPGAQMAGGIAGGVAPLALGYTPTALALKGSRWAADRILGPMIGRGMNAAGGPEARAAEKLAFANREGIYADPGAQLPAEPGPFGRWRGEKAPPGWAIRWSDEKAKQSSEGAKEMIGKRLRTSMTPEVEQSITKAGALREEIPKFDPTLAQQTDLPSFKRAQEDLEAGMSGAELDTAAKRYGDSAAAIRGFAEDAAPEGAGAETVTAAAQARIDAIQAKLGTASVGTTGKLQALSETLPTIDRGTTGEKLREIRGGLKKDTEKEVKRLKAEVDPEGVALIPVTELRAGIESDIAGMQTALAPDVDVPPIVRSILGKTDKAQKGSHALFVNGKVYTGNVHADAMQAALDAGVPEAMINKTAKFGYIGEKGKFVEDFDLDINGPDFAKNLATAKARMGSTPIAESLPEEVGFHDLDVYRSKLLGEIRDAKSVSNPRRTTKEQLSIMEKTLGRLDKTIDTLAESAIPGVKERYRAFADFYKNEFVPRFKQGVSKDMGRLDPTGRLTLKPEDIAGKWFGPNNTTEAKDFMKLYGDNDEAKALLTDHALDDLRHFAAPDGVLDIVKMASWLRKHERVLAELPFVRDAIKGKDPSALYSRLIDLEKRQRVVSDSVLAKALKGEPDKVIDNALKDPKAMRALKSAIRGDEGADKALARAVWDRAVKSGGTDTLLDAGAMAKFMDANGDSLKIALTPKHLDDLRTVIDAAQMQGRTRPPMGRAEAAPSKITQAEEAVGMTTSTGLSGTFAAAQGRTSPRMTILGNFLPRILRSLAAKDAERLWKEALYNPQIAADMAYFARSGGKPNDVKTKRLRSYLLMLPGEADDESETEQ